MKKIKYSVFLLLVLCLIMKVDIVVNASQITSGTLKLDSTEIEGVDFWINEPSIVVIDLDIRLTNGGVTSNDKFVLELEKYPSGGTIEKDVCTLPNGYINQVFSEQYFCQQVITRNHYAYVFDNASVHNLTIAYTIRTFPSLATSFEADTTKLNMTAGTEKLVRTNPIPSNSYLPYKDITTTNSKIAEVYWNRNEGVTILAKKAGTCYINLISWSNYSLSIKVTVKNPKNPKLQYKSYKMCMGESITNALLYSNKTVKWSTSNKKVATVNSKGKITAKGIGKATITAKVGGKKYTCKITVVRQNPDFYATLSWYYTRNNYFEVKFYNNANKAITIYSSGAKVMHTDYKSFDRNLKLKKSTITIKPHKSATIKFYVKGRVTWYDYAKYTLQYKFKFDGKTYTARTWDGSSIYKNGSKWYYTYYDTDAYDYWY